MSMMRHLLLIITLTLFVDLVSAKDDLIVRFGYKYNDYAQDRLRYIPTVNSVPIYPDVSREKQHSIESELEYRFDTQLDERLQLKGMLYAQAHLGRVNPLGLQTPDMPINAMSFNDGYYIGATFPEVYLRREETGLSFDVGFMNPVYGNSSIAVADVFAKARQFVGIRKSEDASAELRQGNLGLRFNKSIGDDELTLIYMPDIEDLHKYSNFGHRLFARYEHARSSGTFAIFGMYQTRDNYDGPYTSILDVISSGNPDFNIPAMRETDNVSVGFQFESGMTESAIVYGEALLSRKTSKFVVTQTGPITGLDVYADANAVSYRRPGNGPYLKFMLGTQYSFTSTDLVRVEYIYDQNGYSSGERNSWLDLLDKSLRLRADQLHGNLRDAVHNFGTFSQNYFFWNYEKRLGNKVDHVMSIGQYVSLDDESFLTFAGYSHALSNQTSMNVRATHSMGSRLSDFGSLGERTSLSVYVEKRF